MTEHVCPEASILAAFAEGVLSPEERAEVGRHVANCPECPAIVGEVTRFLAEGEEEVAPARPNHRWWYVAAAVAALCIPLLLWSRDPLRGVRRIAAQSPARTYEGRLHKVPHARFDSTRGRNMHVVAIALQAEAERLAKRRASADVLHARGLTALLRHQPREASRWLAAAAEASPRDAAIWNDLAVAEIALASVDNRDRAAASALVAANQALTLSPASPDARFNRAVALELLGRAAEARMTYRQALTDEASAAWRDEILARLQRLENLP